MMLTLFDGKVRELKGSEPDAFQQILFEQQVLRIPGVRQRLLQPAHRRDFDVHLHALARLVRLGHESCFGLHARHVRLTGKDHDLERLGVGDG